MKKISLIAMVAMVFLPFLVSCSDDDVVSATLPALNPVATVLVWDEGVWDNVAWQ